MQKKNISNCLKKSKSKKLSLLADNTDTILFDPDIFHASSNWRKQTQGGIFVRSVGCEGEPPN